MYLCFFLSIRRPPRSTRTDTTLSLHDALPISIARPGALNVDLPGGLRLEGEVFVADGYSVDARDWQRQIKESSGHDARLYLQARATSQVAVDPIDLQLTGPRRTAIELKIGRAHV